MHRMFMKKIFGLNSAVLLLLVGLAILSAFSVAGHPLVSPEVLASLGMLSMIGETADVGLIEIKKLIEDQGRTWEEHKKANDELIKAKADGKAVGDLEAKVATLSAALDKFSEMKDAVDKILLKANRPGAFLDEQEKNLAAEVKSFNVALAADYASKGRPAPAPLTQEAYVQYKSAFFGIIRHGNVELLGSDERKALSAGTDPDGGFMLPSPTQGRVVSKLYEAVSMRQLATVQPISSNELEGLNDNDEAAAGWTGETSTRTETATPQVGKWKIVAEEMYASPKATQRLIDDSAIDIEAWLAGKIADKFGRVEEDAFINGNGVAKARGLFAYPTAATADATRPWGTFEHVKTGTNADFGATTKADTLQDLIGAFKEQYLGNATWLMRREVRTKIRKLKEATTDRYLWEPSLQAGQPDRLLGYPVRINQYLPALAAGSLSLGLGDLREAYTIVDRVGVRTLRDPYTAKPYVVFYTTKRTGGGALNYEAFKFVNFSV